jgi:hypothetical protein
VSAPRAATVERFAPYFVALTLIVIGCVFAVQPLVAGHLRDRDEATRLEGRVRALQQAVAGSRSLAAPDEAAPIVIFDQRVSKGDVVADVAERLARLADESAPKGRIRSIRISTGEAVGNETASDASARSDDGAAGPDIRFGLFPSTVSATPVTVSFESSYDAVARFAWRLRGLPTVVDIESVQLTRGLPLMRASIRVLVCRRAGARVAQTAGAAGGRP